jgi:hypothetical protein
MTIAKIGIEVTRTERGKSTLIMMERTLNTFPWSEELIVARILDEPSI